MDAPARARGDSLARFVRLGGGDRASAATTAAAWGFGLWLALSMFAWVVNRNVQPADAGEFQLVVRHLGVAHPPGYPLYTLSAHAFGRIATWPPAAWVFGAHGFLRDTRPGGDAWTWAVSLFSALLAFATLVAVYAATARLARLPAAGFLAAGALALSPTFLTQATTANVRMPTALFTALLALLVARELEPRGAGAGRSARSLGVLALVFGLAVGHHGSLAVLALPLGLAVLAARGRDAFRPAAQGAVLAGLVLSLLPLAYLPLADRAGGPLAPGNLTTVRGFLEHVTAFGFRGDVLYFDDPTVLADRVQALGGILRLQFGPVLLAAAVVGLAWLIRARPLGAMFLALTFVLVASLAVTYRAPQTVEYLLPAYVVLAVLVGSAGGAVAALLGTERRRLADGAVRVATLAVLFSRRELPGAVRASHASLHEVTRVLAADCAPEGATILASWHYATPLWYAAREIAPRPDLKILYVFPEGAEPIGETWRRRLELEAGRPVILTNRTPQILAGTPLWPVPGTPFFAATPPSEPCGGPEHEVEAVLGGRVRVRAAAPAEAAGVPVPVTIHAEAVAPVDEPLTVAAQLVAPTGEVWGQVDHTFPPDAWNRPGGFGDRLDLVPFRGDLPRMLRVMFYIYSTSGTTAERLPPTPGAPPELLLAEVEPSARAAGQPASPAPGEIPFGRAMTLARWSVRRERDVLVADLEWRADTDAAASDYTVSVQVHGDGWMAQDDGTPAQGAIPTLKWLPGMRVADRHRVELPADLPSDAAYRVLVAVYDAFTMEPLPVTDAARVQAGEGQVVEIARSGAQAPR